MVFILLPKLENCRTNSYFVINRQLSFIDLLAVDVGAVSAVRVADPPRIVFKEDNSVNSGALCIRQHDLAFEAYLTFDLEQKEIASFELTQSEGEAAYQ